MRSKNLIYIYNKVRSTILLYIFPMNSTLIQLLYTRFFIHIYRVHFAFRNKTGDYSSIYVFNN